MNFLMTPSLWIFLLIICFLIVLLNRKKRSAENIGLWLTAMMICLIGVQASLAYNQFQSAQRPNVGIEVKNISFEKDDKKGYKTVVNPDGDIVSKLFNAVVVVENYGEKPALIQRVQIVFDPDRENLELTDASWDNLPIFPEQKIVLDLTRPISIEDFIRTKFSSESVQANIGIKYKPMFPGGYEYKIDLIYDYNAGNEKINLISAHYNEIHGKWDLLNIFNLEKAMNMNFWTAFGAMATFFSAIVIAWTLVYYQRKDRKREHSELFVQVLEMVLSQVRVCQELIPRFFRENTSVVRNSILDDVWMWNKMKRKKTHLISLLPVKVIRRLDSIDDELKIYYGLCESLADKLYEKIDSNIKGKIEDHWYDSQEFHLDTCYYQTVIGGIVYKTNILNFIFYAYNVNDIEKLVGGSATSGCKIQEESLKVSAPCFEINKERTSQIINALLNDFSKDEKVEEVRRYGNELLKNINKVLDALEKFVDKHCVL